MAEKEPLPSEKAFRSEELFQTKTASFHLVQIDGTVKPHYHRTHDEVVYIIDGQGILNLAEEETEVGPGFIAKIPSGMVHSFRSTGPEKTVALSVFSPPFDGKDRVFVH